MEAITRRFSEMEERFTAVSLQVLAVYEWKTTASSRMRVFLNLKWRSRIPGATVFSVNAYRDVWDEEGDGNKTDPSGRDAP